jgi:ribosomal protein S18 acetylase RimI-like enzyme
VFLDGNAVGICVFSTIDKWRIIDIEDFVVLPEYRKLGVGRKLIETLTDHAIQNHIDEIHATIPSLLEKEDGFQTLSKIYKKLGFEKTGYGIWINIGDNYKDLIDIKGEKEGYYYVYEWTLEEQLQRNIKFEIINKFGKNVHLIKKV